VLITAVKELSKSVNSSWSYCTKFDTKFCWNTAYK